MHSRTQVRTQHADARRKQVGILGIASQVKMYAGTALVQFYAIYNTSIMLRVCMCVFLSMFVYVKEKQGRGLR